MWNRRRLDTDRRPAGGFQRRRAGTAGPGAAASHRRADAAAGHGDGAGARFRVVRDAGARPRLRAASPGPPGRRRAPHPRIRHQPASGRRQGRAILPARLRRRPRHRRRALRRWAPRQPPEPRARPGIRRPSLPDPRDGPAARGVQGALLRGVRRLRHRGRGEFRAPRRGRRERRGGGRWDVQHAAVPHTLLADARRPQDPRRARVLPQRRRVRASERLPAIQPPGQGARHRERGDEPRGVVLSLPGRVAWLGRDPHARRPRRAHRTLRLDRPQRGWVHAAQQRQRRLELAPRRATAGGGAGVRQLLRARPLQQLHVLFKRRAERRRDQPARPSHPGRPRRPVRASKPAVRGDPHQHRRLPVPHRRAAGRPRSLDPAPPARAGPGRRRRRAVVCALRQARPRPARLAASGHRRARRHLQLRRALASTPPASAWTARPRRPART